MQTLGKSASMTEQESKEQALQEYRKKLLQHKEIDAKVRTLREQVKQSKKEYDKTEDDLKALQSVGQIIAEVLRQLDEERCKSICMPPQCLALLVQLSNQKNKNCTSSLALRPSTITQLRPVLMVVSNETSMLHAVIVKASSGPRYVVGCRNKVDKEKLVAGTRVALDMTTLTIMRYLPREVCMPALALACFC